MTTPWIQEDPAFQEMAFPTKKFTLSKEDATIIGLQTTLAQTAVGSEPTPQSNEKEAFNNGTRMLRFRIASERAPVLEQDRQAVFSSALTEGNTDAAFGVMQFKPENDPLVALEAAAAEGSVAVRYMNGDPQSPETDPEVARMASDNQRLMMVYNAFSEVQSKFLEKYSSSEAFDKRRNATYDAIRSLQEKGLPAPPYMPDLAPEEGLFILDAMKTMFFNTPYALDKSGGSFFDFMFPGTGAADRSQYLWEEGLTDLEFKQRLDGVVEAATTGFVENPLGVYSKFFEFLTTRPTTEGISPFMSLPELKEFDRLIQYKEVKIPVINPETGEYEEKVIPNPLRDMFDPTSFTDRLISSSGVQNITDTPLWDLTMLPKLGKLAFLTKLLGAQGVSQMLAKATVDGNADLVTTLNTALLRHPNQITDPAVQAMATHQVRVMQNALNNIVDPARVNLSPADIAAEQARIAGGAGIENIAFMSHRTDGGNNYMDVFVQSPSGHPFRSEAAVNTEIQRTGLEGAKAHHETGTGWFIKFTQPIGDDGFISPINKVGPATGFGKLQSIVADAPYIRNLWSGNVSATKESFRGATSMHLEASKLARTFADINEPIMALKPKELNDLQIIINAGKKKSNPTLLNPMRRGKWFTEDDLELEYLSKLGRLPSSEEKMAYFSYKNASDFAYVLQNKRLRDELASRGSVKWQFISGPLREPVIAREFDPAKLSDKAAILDIDSGVLHSGNMANPSKLRDPDYVLLHAEGKNSIYNKEFTHILVRKDQARNIGLPDQVLGYQPGGVRMYANKWFAKQKRSGDSPITHFVSGDRKAALKKIAAMNQVRTEYKQFLRNIESMRANGTLNAMTEHSLRMQTDSRISQIDSSWNLNSLEKAISNRRFDLENEIIIRGDREPMPDDTFFDLPELQEYQSHGRLYYSERGDYLPDETGNLAELLSPYEALVREQNHAIRTAAYSNFAIKQMQEWMFNYGDSLKPLDGVYFATPEAMFLHAKPKDSPPNMTYLQQQRAEAIREHIKRTLFQPTEGSIKLNNFKRRIGQSVAENLGDAKWVPQPAANYLGKKAFGMSEADAAAVIKGHMYDLTLGYFNPGSMVTQWGGAITTIAAHPVYGAKAVVLAPFIRILAMNNFDNVMVKLLAKRLNQHGIISDFADFVKDLNNSGLLNVGHTTTMMDQVGHMGKISSIREDGRLFVYEGERMARIASFSVARDLAMEQVKKGKFAKGSQEFMQFIQGEANKVQFGMMSGAESAIQRMPIIELAVQMLNYPMRIMEIGLGLNRQFTAKEKLTILGTLTVLFGAHGFPIAGPEIGEAIIISQFKDKGYTEEQGRENAKWIMYGLSRALNQIIGSDAALGAMWGSGDFYSSVRDMFLGNKESPARVFAGITGDKIVKFKDINENIFRLMAAAWTAEKANEPLDPAMMTDQLAMEVAKLFSGSQHYIRAYHLQRMQVLRGATGTIETDSNFSPVAALLGIRSADENLNFRVMRKSKAHKEMLQETASQRAELERKAYDAVVNGEAQRAEEYFNQSRALIEGMDPRDKKEVDKLTRFYLKSNVTKKWESGKERNLIWVQEDTGE